MNPFTESTVARPLSESPSFGDRDAAPRDQTSSPGTPSPVQEAPPPPARYPRSGRMVRRRTRGQVSRRTGWASSWPRPCRSVAGAVLGLLLTFALPGAWAINVNSATAQQLETITGIGPKTAQIIIDERTRGGSFESFDDLAERVKGIGPKKARSLQAAGLSVGQAAGPAADSKPVASAPRKASR